MSNYFVILKALFKNKFRFDAGSSKGGRVAFFVLLGFVYVMVMALLISVIVLMKDMLALPEVAASLYFFILMTASLIVLFFGIIHLVSTLYLSKDTDFYSMLPVKPSTVFTAKLSFVYITETAIVALIVLPLFIVHGIVTKMWAWFYVLTLLSVFIVPLIPLVAAAIIAVPVMLIAGKLRNRSVVALIFYLVLFGGFFGAYIFFIFKASSGAITPERVASLIDSIEPVLDIFYPLSALAFAACGVQSFGLGLAASTLANLAIFVGIAAALAVIIWLLSKFMYAQAAKANNQTDASGSKKGEFKTSSGMKSLIKREYLSSLRTTQTAFQCYAVMILPIMVAVVFGVLSNSISGVIDGSDMPDTVARYMQESIGRYFTFLGGAMLCAMFATLGTAAATTFSREGKALASLKVLPVGIKTVFFAKVTAWLAIGLPVALVSIVIVNVFNFRVDSFLLMLFALLPLVVALVVFDALWDLRSPKLNWTDPIQAIKHNGNVTVGQLLSLAGGIVIMIMSSILSSLDVDFEVSMAIGWALMYVELLVFAIVDVVMYRKLTTYYNRLEM